ncbi:MAG: hypothetical protein SH848_21480 [Saprospiraceae bacterium]|nr:hypothetical protein [Saprospiraceae bacterium]MDZ4706516.1 hypothetical protein [Saprospiraceae bacterium]
MMQLKFVIALLAIAGIFWTCESSESNSDTKQLLDAAKSDTEKMMILNDLSSTLQGIWQSEDDPKSKLRIQGDQFFSIYDGNEISKDRLLWYPQCPGDCSAGQDLSDVLCFTLEDAELKAICYKLISVSKKRLQYTSLSGTGKTLSYKKVGEIPKKETPQ